MFEARPVNNKAQLAAASIGGIAERYAVQRLDWQQGAEEIQATLARYRIRANQVVEVLSTAAAGYLTTEGDRWYAADALRLLLDVGADESRARAVKAERDSKPRIRIGDAQL
jgi:hypothetical protein